MAYSAVANPAQQDPLNHNLPEDLQLQLRSLCKKFSGRELKDRRWELKRARKARFFWRGVQHLIWNDDTNQGNLMAIVAGPDNTTEQPTFRRAYNLYTAYGKAFTATFCGNQPSTIFEPDNPKESIDIQAASAANKFKRIFEKWNPPKQIQMELARLFWTDDRVAAWTRYEVDGERWGYDTDEETGQVTPRGREITTLHGVLEHKCPITLKDPCDFVYQKISQDLDLATIKGKFKHISEEISESNQGVMDDAFARNVRIAAAQGTTSIFQGAESVAHLGTIDYFWIRPDAFMLLEEEYRAPLQQLFSHGCRVAFCGDIYAEACDCSMDDQLTIFHAQAGDGQNRNGLGDALIPVQEIANNIINMLQEYAEYGIAEEWYDISIFDIEANENRRAVPGGRQAFARSANTPADDYFHTSESPQPPQWLIEHLQWLQASFAQFLSGQQAAIFGKSDNHNETAKGIELLRDQALGLVSLVWMPFCIGWANVVHQAVKAASANRTGMVSSLVSQSIGNRGSETVEVDVTDLRGAILASPETDENFPESWTSKSNRIMTLMEQAKDNPILAEDLATSPNKKVIRMALGLEELYIKEEDGNDKQLAEIDELLLQAPMPNQQAIAQYLQQGGDPNAIMGNRELWTTTIPIDPDFDDSKSEWEAGMRWVNDPQEGQKAKRENPPGFLNVQLHLLQHKAQNDQADQQQFQMKLMLEHPPAQPEAPQDPEAQAAKSMLLKDAADAVQQLDVLAHLPAAATMGNIQGQVAAAKEIVDAAVKASTSK